VTNIRTHLFVKVPRPGDSAVHSLNAPQRHNARESWPKTCSGKLVMRIELRSNYEYICDHMKVVSLYTECP